VATAALLVLATAACDDPAQQQRTPAPGGPAVGVTDDEIRIAFAYAVDQEKANEAVGAGEITGGPQKDAWDAVIEDVNADGGIAGRTVVPVYYEYNALAPESEEVQDQAACERLTNDEEVYAVLGAGNTQTFAECVDDAGLWAFSSDLSQLDGETMARYAHYFEPSGFNLDRVARATVASLGARDFFPQDAVVGVLTHDNPYFDHALNESLLPALSDLGITPAEVAQVTLADTEQEIEQMSTQLSSAVLRFKQSGVTHVVILEASGGIMLLFGGAADAQKYRPRYGLSSHSGNSAIAPLLPPTQLEGALSIGWAPLLDLSEADGADHEASPAEERCLDLMRENGITFDSTNATVIALGYCELLWLVQQAIEAAALDGEITADTLGTGVESLGDSFEPASTFSMRFGPGLHDGVGSVADMAFEAGCTCFRYEGDPYPVP
jgi:ABC-type branched-subunit amino acid transport system substrate-binding protein